MKQVYTTTMKFSVIFLLLCINTLLLPFTSASAQMMGGRGPVMQGYGYVISVTPSPQDVNDINTGKDLFTKFQNKQVSCNNIKDDDFEKIGEYVMQQRFTDIGQHVQVDNNIKQMMGEQAEEQMHIRLGRNATGCFSNQQGGENGMMGGFYPSMMNSGWGYWFGSLWLLAYIFVMIDLVLAAIWLWRQIKRR